MLNHDLWFIRPKKTIFDKTEFDSAIDSIVKLTKEVNERDKGKALNNMQNVLPLTWKN